MKTKDIVPPQPLKMKTIVNAELLFSEGEDAYTVDVFVGKLDHEDVVSRIKKLYPDAVIIKISIEYFQGKLKCSVEE